MTPSRLLLLFLAAPASACSHVRVGAPGGVDGLEFGVASGSQAMEPPAAGQGTSSVPHDAAATAGAGQPVLQGGVGFGWSSALDESGAAWCSRPRDFRCYRRRSQICLLYTSDAADE